MTKTEREQAAVDMIIPWREVTAADLVVLDGVLTTPERVHIYKDIWNRETGETFIRVDVSHRLDNGHLVTCEQRGDSLTAVRRYVETEPDALRQQVQQARNAYYEAACEHSEMAGHEEQEARASGRVSAYDDVLRMLDGSTEGSEGHD